MRQAGIRRGIPLVVLFVFLVWACLDQDERTWSLLRNTLILGGFTAVLAVPAGTLLAILIRRTEVAGRRLAGPLLLAMLFLPLYLQAAGWDSLLGRQLWLGRTVHPDFLRFTVAIWIHTLSAIPWVATIVSAGLAQIPSQLEESALLQMAPVDVIWRVTLPLTRPFLLAAGWWSFAMAVGDMTVTDLYQVRTFAEEIYVTIPLLEPEPTPGSGAAVLPRGTGFLGGMLMIAMIVVLGLLRHDVPPEQRNRISFPAGRQRWLWSAVLIASLLVVVGVPLVNLVYDAGAEYGPEGSERPGAHWSAVKLVTVVGGSPWAFRRELLWSLLVGTGAATLAMIVAVPLAWFARRPSLGSWLAAAVISVGAAIPGPLISLALIAGLNREEIPLLVWLYDRTLLAPVLAAANRALPVAVVVSWWGCRSVPSALVDVARLDGLSWVGQWRYVAWPLRRELFIAGWLASFAIAAGDLSATMLVTPPGVSTLPIRIFGLLHAGVDDQVAGVCLVNLLLCIGLAGLAIRLLGRSK